jgi:putative transposase
MNVARSTYYYRLKTEEKRNLREKSDLNAKELIDGIHVEFPFYGYRMLHEELLKQGVLINEKKIRRIQKKFGLFAFQIRKFIRTTDSKHQFKRFPNLLNPRPLITGPNQVWGADITYIRILEGFVFLAAILDLYSRRVIGWGISERIDRNLTTAALKMALNSRKPPSGCVHHSDQGVQYACEDYMQLVQASGLRPSMSRTGNPYDNAFVESFMKTLKYNEIYLGEYETMDDVIRWVPNFIENVYNKKRLHSSLGYLTPVEFEEKYNQDAEVILN